MQEPSPTTTISNPPLPPSSDATPQRVTAGGRVSLLLAYAGFIGLGLVASRTGVTWPAIRATFGMPIDAISMLLMAQLIGSIAVSASIGATLGPALMTALLASSLGWQVGFLAIGVLELILAIGFITTRRTWLSSVPTPVGSLPDARVALSATLRLPVAWLGILLFVAFIGAQTSAGQWFFSVLTDERGVLEALAGIWISLF